MRVDKKRKSMQETLSSLDGVLVALNSYPNLEDALLERGQSEIKKYMGKMFPTQIDFAKEILEHLVGTDVLIDYISTFLTIALPGIEVGVKSVLLANMQNLGANCTIDPFIYEKAIKEGILFDLRQIDLYDKLTVSPLDKKIGQYYYFGIDDCESAYDVLQSAISPNNQTEKRKLKKTANGQKIKQGTSYLNRAMSDTVGHYFGGRKRDFDCLLWYMKNKGVTRQVWGKRTSAKEDIFNGGENVQDWINKKGNKKSIYYKINSDGKTYVGYVKTGSKREATSGTLKHLDKNQTYKFRIKDKYYEYYYGNPLINKLSRKNFYYNEKSAGTYEIFYYKENEWKKVTKDLENYQSIESIPTDTDTIKNKISKDNFIVIDNILCYIKDNPVVRYVTKKGKTETIIKSIDIEKCIDITENLKNNTCLYVDYDELQDGVKKGEKINKGDNDIKTSLPDTENDGKKQWVKTRQNPIDENTPPKQNICYFEDIDGDGKYTPNVDKIIIPPYDTNGFYVNVTEQMEKKNKYTHDFGVLTLEYSPRTGNIIQSDGVPMHQQTPYDNVLHVFFGNVKEINTTERDAAEDAWHDSSNLNKQGQTAIKKIENFKKIHQKSWKRVKQELKQSKTNEKEVAIKTEAYISAMYYYNVLLNGGKFKDATYENTLLSTNEKKDDVNYLTEKIQEINDVINLYEKTLYDGSANETETTSDDMYNLTKLELNYSQLNDFINTLNNKLKINDNHYYSISAFSKRISQIMDYNENLFYLKARNATYPEAKKNYYYKRTLFEFNTDYINSIQLFDPKVMAAQLITSLFGGLTMDLMIGVTASWKTELIRDVVKDMVEKQIASEDFAVSDCFFTFTNDAYNGMLRAAELRQAGLYSRHGEENGANTIDPVKILEGLNDFANCADQAGQTTIIRGVITNAAAEVNKDVYGYKKNKNEIDIDMSFIETLIINLCTQLVMAVLSPKVYLLILINLELFGLSTNYDLKSFLENFNNIIRNIVKHIVDEFMAWIINKISEILEKLIPKLAFKLSLEQVEIYARLIKQILSHLRMLTLCGGSDGSLAWTQDMPSYADIVNSESTQEPIDEC